MKLSYDKFSSWKILLEHLCILIVRMHFRKINFVAAIKYDILQWKFPD